jgi:uncharacterized membrane protein
MKERSITIIITVILVILGIIIGLITSGVYIIILSGTGLTPYTQFNFYKSELNINGTHIRETLNFQTNQPYHTLFRNFQSTITTKDNLNIANSISINSVDCQNGDPYFRVGNYCYYNEDFTKPNECVPYTESNEYGCTYVNLTEFNGLKTKTNKECANPQGGILESCTYNHYIFNQGQNYQISSNFTLNPDNLFYINGKYYIKFIAYGRNSHTSLTLNNNLFISGDAVYTTNYPSNKYTIIYIPYSENISRYSIINQNDFVYDTPQKPSSLVIALLIIGITLLHLLPAIFFFFTWFFFGKELTDGEVPDQLSQYPNKRKPWEVAAFFNPPFGKINKDFFSTMLLDFYRRKIVDLKPIKGFLKQDLMIKINKQNTSSVDHIERRFLEILAELKDLCPKEHMDGDYFNLNKSGNSYISAFNLRTMYLDLQTSLDKESKQYLEKKGIIFFMVSMVILTIVSFIFAFGLAILTIISIIIVSILSATTSLLLRYKGEFYTEYKEWQSFKKWLKYSPAMKETGAKGVVLWDEYLVYATALGVSKQVLKELKKEGLIDDKRYNFYSGVYVSSTSFAMSSSGGHSGGGGGFGGGGGGGVGGGGGGGR